MRRRRIGAAALALLALTVAAAVATGVLPLWPNEVPEVGVEVYFEPGAGNLTALAEAGLVATGNVTDIGSRRWRPGASALPWERDLVDVYHSVEIQVHRVIGSDPERGPSPHERVDRHRPGPRRTPPTPPASRRASASSSS